MKKVLRVLLIILLILVLIVAGGFAYLYFNGMSGVANTTVAKEGQIKIACAGDSTTYGHGISGWPKNNYPSVLQNLLGEKYHVNNYGVSSFAVQEDADRSYRTLPPYQESLAYDTNYVVFMMGSNDSKPVNWKGADAFRADLLSLLDSYGDAELILCTLPSAFFLEGQTEGTTNHNIQPLIVDEIARITREVADERGYTLIDIHALTAQHPEWFAKDGVHPSNEGAAAVAREVYKVLSAK
jgi:lysophospholipase L1-like esterase